VSSVNLSGGAASSAFSGNGRNLGTSVATTYRYPDAAGPRFFQNASVSGALGPDAVEVQRSCLSGSTPTKLDINLGK
jgi:hypothetical protein